MLTLLAYAYSVGERSSRQIERRCREDVAFRVICANQVPDHATIARFRVRHEAALGELFSQVLDLCARAGLVEAGVLAVDGTKLAAAASEKQTRAYDRIAAEILAEAGRIDAAEDEIHGPARGDELPEHLARREGRQAWLRDAKQRLDAERAELEESIPRARAKRLALCQRRLAEDWRSERLANREYEAYRERGVLERGRQAMGSGPRPYTPPERPEGKIRPASAGPMTSCVQPSPPRPVAISTHEDGGWSSRSSPRSRRTGALGASNAEAGRPLARNGV